MRAVRLLLVALLAAIALSFGHTAAAQEAPVPNPLDQVPLGELAPVFELVGPAVSPVCGGVGLVVFLSPPVLSGLGELGSLVLPLLGPVLTLCGAVPTTSTQDRWTCALDDESQVILAQLLIPLAGIGPVVDVRPAGIPLDQLQVIADALPPEFGLQQLLTQTATVLQCRQGTAEEPAPSTTVPLADVPTTTPPELPTPVVIPVSEVLAPLPDVVAAPEVPLVVAPQPAFVTRLVPRVPFSYAGVFLVPFAVLAAAAWFGRGLARPLRELVPSDPQERP